MKLKFLVDSLRSTEKNYCGLKVFENQNFKFNYDPCPTGELVFDFGDINNETIIKFVLSKKIGKYTILQNGVVIKDTAIKIKKILIDDIDVYPKINLFSNYFTDKGAIKTNGYIGFNGEYKFKFRYPLARHLILCDYYD